MIFIYVFYIDVFLQQNFLMYLIVLSLTNIFCKSPVRRRRLRMLFSALLGAVLSAALLLGLPSYGGAIFGMAFFVVPMMLLLNFGFVNIRQFMLRIAVSWLAVIIVNGVVSAFYNLTGIRSLYIYVGILVLLVSRLLVASLMTSVDGQRRRMQVVLRDHGRSVSCMGLYDSGNLLQMPLSGEPVHIIDPALLQNLWGNDSSKVGQVITYHALGTDRGQISVYCLDEMEVRSEKEKKIYPHPWVGRAEDTLLRGKSYQVILNAGVVDNGNE